MRKIDIINKLAEANKITKKAATEYVDDIFAIIADGIKDEGKVEIFGFGKFETAIRAAREGVNPRTGETLSIPERKGIRFKPASGMKDAVNQ